MSLLPDERAAACANAARVNAARTILDEPGARWPDRVAIVGTTAHITYAGLSHLTNRAGNALRALGCAPGDRVLLAMPDSLELVAALLGAIKIGALAVPVPPLSAAADFEHYLRDTGARLAIVDPCALEELTNATNAAHAIDATDVTVLATGLATGLPQPYATSRVLSWRRACDAASARLETRLAPPDEPALVLFTSGSTGRQKPVVHAHRALLAAIQHVGIETFGFTPADRILSTARLFFAFGLGFGMSIPLAAGLTTILKPTKDVLELARIIAESRPTVLCGVPSLLDVLLRASGTWGGFDLSSLRFIVSAGEPLPAAVYEGYRDHLGVEVLDGIGSTEMLTHFITHRPGRSSPASCGTAVPGCEIQLVDDDGAPVADGEIGNLRVSGGTAFLGYGNRPAATAYAKQPDGVVTGDKMYRDARGLYHYCGRSDDMLKVSGMWVAPRDIEAALCGHPNVERCAVTTREDRNGRRRLVAYVIARSATPFNGSDLYRYAGDHLPDYMIPAAFVVLEALPLTPNGKLKRSALPEPEWGSGTLPRAVATQRGI